MNRKVILHGKRCLYDGFFKLEEARVSYEKFDGRMSPVVSRLNLERGDSVAAVVFDADTRELILVEQFRYAAWEKGPGWVCEIVAGMIDAEETPETAIRREIREETGYAVTRLEKIAVFYLTPGGSSERVFLYYAEATPVDRAADGADEGAGFEDIRAVRLSLDEARDRLSGGSWADAKTLIGILWLLRRLER